MKFNYRRNIGISVLVMSVVLLLPVSASYASGLPSLDFKPTVNVIAGRVPDGKVLGYGQVVFQSDHIGFVVWSEAIKFSDSPGRYVLNGQEVPTNRLRVRLEKEGSVADTENGKGVLINTGDSSVSFTLVADGEQQINSDRYPITLSAVAILP